MRLCQGWLFLSMVTFTARLHKAPGKGGWTYFEIPKSAMKKLKAGATQAFRVKGTLDKHPIRQTSVMPAGNGRFLMPFNAAMRKGTGKRHGDAILVSLTPDLKQPPLSRELLDCLKDDAEANAQFKSLSRAMQQYYSKWIDDAKTPSTKTKRLVACLTALGKKLNYHEMMLLYRNFDNEV